MRILNIHGFDGNCCNTNFSLLTGWGHEVVSLQLDYREKSLDDIYSMLMSAATSEKVELIVATSFGAFFGKRIANQLGLKCIFTNPCLRPDISLKAIASEYFTEANSRIVTDWVNDQKSYSYKDDAIIIGTADEVIDHENITKYEAAQATFYIVEDGFHRLNMNQYSGILKTILS